MASITYSKSDSWHYDSEADPKEIVLCDEIGTSEMRAQYEQFFRELIAREGRAAAP